MMNQGFEPDYKTVVVVHGYLDSGNEKWLKEISEKILKRDPETNIVRVDWHKGSRKIDYLIGFVWQYFIIKVS